MSSKTDTKNMNQEKKRELKPKLRFPEFRDTGEWEMKQLGKVYSFKVTNSFSRDKLNYENGSVKNIHYGDIHTKFSTLFDIKKELVPFVSSSQTVEKIKLDSYCVEGDMVFADASEDLNDVGKSMEIVNLNNEKLISGLHTLLARQIEFKLVIGFSGYLFQSNSIRNRIQKVAHGTKVLGISAGRLAGIEIYFPTDKREQQKIADCLTSIDDRITAETQKLSTLKVHKKGLMQQLFPAEGETVPDRRFPEFQDNWKIAKIDDFVESYKGGAPLTPSDFSTYSDYEVIPKKAIGAGMWLKMNTEKPTYCKESFYKENLRSVVDSNYLIITLRDLVPSGPSIGYVVKYANKKNYILAQGVYGLKINKTIISDFLIHFSNTGKYRKMMQSAMVGSTQVHIRNSVYLNLPISVPTLEEQQKIADCLSSLHELITAQTQKIDILKTHKKGLMQQLFPAVEDAIE